MVLDPRKVEHHRSGAGCCRNYEAALTAAWDEKHASDGMTAAGYACSDEREREAMTRATSFCRLCVH